MTEPADPRFRECFSRAAGRGAVLLASEPKWRERWALSPSNAEQELNELAPSAAVAAENAAPDDTDT